MPHASVTARARAPRLTLWSLGHLPCPRSKSQTTIDVQSSFLYVLCFEPLSLSSRLTSQRVVKALD